VKYIGHTLTTNSVKPDESKVEAIKCIPTPKSVIEVQRYLGCVNYLSKFLPGMSDVSKPLRKLVCTKNEWYWGDSQQKAFDETKRLLTIQAILNYYDVTKPVVLQCNATNTGTGAVLLQDGKPIAFASRTLTPTEQNYAVIEKECLAICHATDKFYHYIIAKIKFMYILIINH